MDKQKVYIDTSVIGGCSDIEFSHYSNILIDKFKDGLLIPVISEVVKDEIRSILWYL